MKSTILLAMVLLATVPWGDAVPRGAAPPPGVDSTIRALEDRERLAVLRQDIAALEGLWSEQLVVNTPQHTISPDRAAVLALVRQGRISYSRFERRVEAIRLYDDLAVVMGSETVVRRDDAPNGAVPIERRFSHVWRRADREWRLIARHANVIPSH